MIQVKLSVFTAWVMAFKATGFLVLWARHPQGVGGSRWPLFPLWLN